MNNIKSEVATESQAGNVSDLLLSCKLPLAECTSYTLQIICTGTPSAGTVSVKYKVAGGDRWLTLRDKNGVAVAMNLTTDDTINIDGVMLESVKITMASFATATAWRAKLRGW